MTLLTHAHLLDRYGPLLSGENAPKKPRGCAAFSFLRALFRALSPAYAAYGAPESPSAAIG